MTAVCVRGYAASVGLLVTGKDKKKGESKRTTGSKSTQLMGIQGIIKEMCYMSRHPLVPVYDLLPLEWRSDLPDHSGMLSLP